MKVLLARILAWVVGYKEDAPPSLGYLLRVYIFPKTPISVSFKQYFLRSRTGFGLWFFFRRWRNALTRLWRSWRASINPEGHEASVAEYNFQNVWRITRQRTERLINVLKSLRSVDPQHDRILVIGPRNEAEQMLLAAHGFNLGNMTAIDLFSVSPQIHTMDMHDMSFPDDSFDIVYSAYVLTYSSDLGRACREMARVVRDGGLIVVAFGLEKTDQPNVVGLRALRGQLPELYEKFDGQVAYIHWQEEADHGNVTACSTIFRVDKPRLSDSPAGRPQ